MPPSPTSGSTDLAELLATLRPARRDGEFVVVSVEPGDTRFSPVAMIDEGRTTTLVLLRADADAAGLDYDFVGAWITLTVHSSLAAVGLTAAFATALGAAGISCNVFAGFFHDHLLVPVDRADETLEILRGLAQR